MDNPPPRKKYYRPSIPWDETMEIGPGSHHDLDFIRRINKNENRTVGNGTVEDPKICWIHDDRFCEFPDTREKFSAIEAIIKEEAGKRGMSYIWILKEGHKSSNVKKLIVTDAEGKEKMTVVKSDDDSHITLRMGTSSNVTNLHGHFYLIYEGNNCKNVAIRMMHEDERGIKGGKNPQLWVWGPYPDHYKRSPIKYPKSPFEIKPGSILDKQRIMEERDSD